MTNIVRADAPAKVNLALHVTGRRDDGYHLLETLVVFVEPGDCITVSAAASDMFEVSGPYAADVPRDASNLVLRARNALRAAAAPCSPVAIELEKNLPVASGVGGGSSDAAATLRALSRLWGLEFGKDRLIEIGAPLGADLPMCLTAHPLIARGTGDIIEPLDAFFPLALVLANNGTALATPDVFAALEHRNGSGLPPLPRKLRPPAFAEWLGQTRNDLEEPACRLVPEIGDVLAELTAAGASLARMSGSGATCFGTFAHKDAAVCAAERIKAAHPGWFVAAAQSIALGVVSHARI